MNEMMLKVDNVTKEYRLGAIGGTTLREEIQRRRAKRRHQADPTAKIGEKRSETNEKFLALKGVSFEVKRGEALGIIGHNGAGKSTLLKLITRITAPTTGHIYYNGRVASMLEVGTGFHPELTGRENVYLNGAILGMTKKEITDKMEEIIEFSEVREFIDTPVKRYSSGMYVKLAFSVAAHLDSELVIMDEVLAVGDVAFQNKCIRKMKEIASSGRTVLYVSHNMATIRGLCSRCIVLSHGEKIFDGDIESAISVYLSGNTSMQSVYELTNVNRSDVLSKQVHINRLSMKNGNNGIFTMGEKMIFDLDWSSKIEFSDMQMRIGIFTYNQTAIGIAFTDKFSGVIGENTTRVCLDISPLLPGRYRLEIIMNQIAEDGRWVKHDRVNEDIMIFEVVMSEKKPMYIMANASWGNFELPSAKIVEQY